MSHMLLRGAILTAMALGLFSGSLAIGQAKPHPSPQLPPDVSEKVGQIVLVTSPSWNSPVGQLERLERRSGQWVRLGRVVIVNFGDKGLAWGRGLHRPVESKPQKKEGDHRATAGIFAIGPVFGYSSTAPVGTKLPYRSITDRDYFVDDTSSSDYNSWLTIAPDEPNDPAQRWNSFEVMKRPDGLYRLGIVIQQNVAPVVPDKGSAIFFHVWRGPNSPTVGCTSMSFEDLVDLVTWLDPAKSPVVVQAPAAQVAMLRFATSP